MRITLFIVTILLFSFVGCKSRNDRVNDFVKNYNLASETIKSSVISHTHARQIVDTLVRLTFATTLEDSEAKKEYYTQLFPDMYTELLLQLPDTKILLNEGVSFEVVFLAKNNQKLLETFLNKSTVNDYEKRIRKSNLATLDSENKQESQQNPLLPNEYKSYLKILNRNLPFEDKSSGCLILAIDINNQRQLVYQIQVPDSLSLYFRDPLISDVLKQEVKNNKQIENVLMDAVEMGVIQLKAEYYDSKKELLTSVTVNKEDYKK